MELFQAASVRWSRIVLAVTACAGAGLILAMGRYGVGTYYTVPIILLVCLAIVSFIRDARLRTLADRLDAATALATKGPTTARLARAIALVESALASSEERAGQRHAMTGLPTREPLLAAMAGDGQGTLGVIRLADFDRLCAFDLALGERVLGVIADRLTRMLPATRLVAHVDRANLAIWFGPEIDEPVARTELDAIGYALGDAIRDGERVILPDIGVRLATWHADGGSAQSALAKSLSLASMRPGEASMADTPMIDPENAARDRYAMEQDLRQAIARGEFRMHYQPLIDATDARVSGAEALIRWHHPTRGLVPPSRFVPVMEAIGLAHEIGMWAMNAAAREAKCWQTAGLAGLRVAVNLSGHQLDRDDLPALVERTLARHSLRSDAFEIELTESVAMGDGDRAARLFSALRKLGVRIAIDDFGTGFSSFSTLRTLSFDKIKIDREFVTNVDTRRDSQAICQSIIALGRGLGIGVLAEGVERRAEYSWLRRHGCAQFQGYLFAPPLEGAAFLSFVRDRSGLAAKLASGPRATPRKITERLMA